LPQMTIVDDGAAQAGLARAVTIRFSQATRFRVRAGPDNRSIVVVLDGLGAALRAASTIPPLPLADAKRRYVVTIQSSSDPNVRLEAPIPASMQDFEVFSSRRAIVNDGHLRQPSRGHTPLRGQQARQIARGQNVVEHLRQLAARRAGGAQELDRRDEANLEQRIRAVGAQISVVDHLREGAVAGASQGNEGEKPPDDRLHADLFLFFFFDDVSGVRALTRNCRLRHDCPAAGGNQTGSNRSSPPSHG
jgi:hypothetical protein